MIIHQCDRCGKKSAPLEHKHSTPGKWREVRFSTGYQTSKTYQICPDCAVVLKIEDNKALPDLGDRLLDIIEEIVSGYCAEN